MTRTSHKAHPTPQFPVYAVDWADEETLILAGGGGATKSGIENKIVRDALLYHLMRI
jgi:prolactin regulatory element-binding protein